MKTYIAYIWKYNHEKVARMSRSGESLPDFKARVSNIFPTFEDWHIQFSEFNEIQFYQFRDPSMS